VQRQARNGTSEPVKAEEVKAEQKGQSREAPVTEGVNPVVSDSAAPVEEVAAAVTNAVEAPAGVEEASAPAKQQSKDTEESADLETTFSFTPSHEKSHGHSAETVSDTSPSASILLFDEAPRKEPEDSSLANSAAATTVADADIVNTTENAMISEQRVLAFQANSESIVASPNATTREESEIMDTFLLPAPTGLPFAKRPAVKEDELVVIDKEHGEASDGDNWSVVEA